MDTLIQELEALHSLNLCDDTNPATSYGFVRLFTTLRTAKSLATSGAEPSPLLDVPSCIPGFSRQLV